MKSFVRNNVPVMRETTGFQYTDDAVPRAYDEILVPRMFGPLAQLLLNEADVDRGAVVLDVATGPGTVARLAAQRVGPDGRVVATDISCPMLDLAKSKPSPLDAAPITYIEFPAAPLAVESAVFDVVVCQQGLQFFPDRLAALREMRRALKPEGRLAVAVWCRLEDNPINAALHAALRDSVPSDLADRALAPSSWSDPQVIKDTIDAAGFRESRVRKATLPLVFEGGVAQVVSVLSATPLAPSLAALPQTTRDAINAAARARLSPFLKQGMVRGEMTSNVALAYA